ncbi:MAG: group II truncated hemoglobin [Methylovirgula sp.]
MTSSSAPQVLFTEIGGQSAVDRLVDSFYHRMDTLPEAKAIRAMHADDLTSVKNVLKRYLCEWLGGPKLYSQERGHPRLRQRHMHFQIGLAERDAWMLCMQGAVEEVVENTVLRGHLLQAFFKLADWVRNDSGNPHDSQH